MKKVILYSLILLSVSVNAIAQKDAQAKFILNAVSAKYHSYNTVKSDFTFTIDDAQAGQTQIQNGTLIVQAKTNKYKMTIYSDNPADKGAASQEIISDGKSQWTYLKKDKEVQLNNVSTNDESFNPAQMFTLYEKGYKYLFTGTGLIKGRTYQFVDLTPEDINKEFFKVRLTIDKVKHEIYNALIFDKNGQKYNYTIRTLTPNPQVPEGTFTFDKKEHPGIEVVDLR